MKKRHLLSLKVNISNAQSQNLNKLRAIFLSYNNKKAKKILPVFYDWLGSGKVTVRKEEKSHLIHFILLTLFITCFERETVIKYNLILRKESYLCR